MPYAKDDQISKSELPGGIEITDQDYADALTAKLSGRETIVISGAFVVRDQSPGAGYTWVDGAWAAPAPDPVVVDTSIPNLTPTQFHTMLNLGGYRVDIEAYLDGLDQATDAVFIASVRAKLDYSTFFVRNDPMILALMAVLDIDEPTMDAMWTTATSF